MYKNSTKDPLVAIVTAGMGAGLVACFWVSQGQNLIEGIAVTAFATAAALVIDRFFFSA